jgi:hypothetical protein
MPKKNKSQKPVASQMQRLPVAFVILMPNRQSFGVRIPPNYNINKNKPLIDAAYEYAHFQLTTILEEEEQLKRPLGA